MLYIIATPIGNLKDITLRALEVLQSVDTIICEDTRRTSLLLNHYQISYRHSREGGNPTKKSLIVMNDYNESKIIPIIVDRLNSGQNLALVSDAGTPLISDPGYKLVRECLHQGIQVDSLPGPSSVITALTLSGLPPDKFLFVGYPPEKVSHRINFLRKLLSITHPATVIPNEVRNLPTSEDPSLIVQGDKQGLKLTYVMFVPPHKLLKTLEDMKEVFGDIEVVLAKELTKIHQSVEKKTINEWLMNLKSPKGEYILLFRV